ncbi:hypothetical protein D3C75_1368700 [compost metagenome]
MGVAFERQPLHRHLFVLAGLIRATDHQAITAGVQDSGLHILADIRVNFCTAEFQ